MALLNFLIKRQILLMPHGIRAAILFKAVPAPTIMTGPKVCILKVLVLNPLMAPILPKTTFRQDMTYLMPVILATARLIMVRFRIPKVLRVVFL